MIYIVITNICFVFVVYTSIYLSWKLLVSGNEKFNINKKA